ncbi:MAG: ABC transporter ATP-binding protein [Bacteroidia bacterium]|jgi:ATP-binding cassette subfamily B protein|nr:ABC transporter ATP-binding protein [Bacteroidota bacterium]MBK7572201.1 ABC transporter ATP-binding protein [Bacteroidota bacterium]MBP9789894.1 ABC transporter ATP-binding protein [Bacteroidia bacterium]MBP9922500.1 ABC transporter ATP-binding protein [Bacteroidia bacterium]
MKALKHLNKYLLKYKWHLILGGIFVIAQNFGAIYPAQVVRKSIDAVTLSMKSVDSGSSPEAIAAIKHEVGMFLLLIIGVALFRGVLMFLMRQTIIVMSRRIEFDLKNEIYNQYQKLSLAFYRRNNTGDLMNRISEDVGRVRMYVGPAIMYSINLIILFVLITISMLVVNVKLTLFVLAPLPFLSISIYYVSDLMNKKSEQVQSQQSRLSTYVQEAFSGIRILKSFVKEEASSNEFAKESEDYLKKNMELVRVNSFFFPLMLLLVGLSTLLTVYIGGKEVIAGRATNGNIAEFIIYVNMLTWPVASLGWVTSIIQRAAASQERINEFLHLEPEIVSNNTEDKVIAGKIEFQNVGFVYPDSGIKALDNISFTVTPGKSLAILGKTGSGKSTIANLLLRMYDPTKGKVLIDDINIEALSLTSIRKQTGYVPQDVFLFSDSIANNIAFGLTDEIDEDKKRELVYTAAKQAVIYDNIEEFPKKFETMIGERGITLSGGQKQRLSIARAIIKHPKILIFDDCLSAVDTNTERKILDNLEQIMKGRTSLIISHRISSVKHADEIIFLDGGRIIERGDHDVLMQKNGEYAALFEKQMLEELEA